MKKLLAFNGLLLVISFLILYFKLSSVLICYSLSRIPPLSINLYRLIVYDIGTKTVNLHVRRLVKILIFWYEIEMMAEGIPENFDFYQTFKSLFK